VIGVLLSFPGVSYLLALNHLSKLGYPTAVTALVVIGFSLVQLVLLEVPLLAFTYSPEQTSIAVERAKAWGRGHWRKYTIWGLAVISAALIVRGGIELL
jgi:hypothetical protein